MEGFLFFLKAETEKSVIQLQQLELLDNIIPLKCVSQQGFTITCALQLFMEELEMLLI